MRILVTFAVEAEFAPWRRLRPFQKASAADVDCFSAKVDGGEIRVMLTGVGGKKAWLEATKSIWNAEVDICISSGLAGALREGYGLGTVLAAEKVLASKSDQVAVCDPVLVDSAVSLGAKRASCFYTADRVILSSGEKRKLGTFADAVEMESGEVLQEAGAFGAKVIAIRSISDTVDEDLPLDFNKVTNNSGDVSMKRILGEVLSAPGSIPALVRFGQNSRKAAESLALFLESYLGHLLQSRPSPASLGAGR